MVILGKMAHLFSGFIDLLLNLLMDGFEVPDFLVQLLLLRCWAGSLSLLAPSFA